MYIKFSGNKTWIAGSRGLVGRALSRVIPDAIINPSHQELDLTCCNKTEKFIFVTKPDLIFLAAARVGGIADNASHPADFITQNLQIQTNVISAAAKAGVKKLVFLGSSCIYPRDCPQPMREEYLMTGPLEETNRAYATAKLAGIEMVRAYRRQYGCDFISVLPCNLYGPDDTYDATRSHVIPALMLKIRAALDTGASSITVWGSGTPLREFLHVDDLARALVHLAHHYSDEAPINIGTDQEISIAGLVTMLCDIAGFKGDIAFDPTKPDGTPRKVLDITRLSAASWQAQIGLRQGLESVWAQFLAQDR